MGEVADVEHEMRHLRWPMKPDEEQGIEMSELAIEAGRLRQVGENTKSLSDSLRLIRELETISGSARASSTLRTSSPVIRTPSQPSSSARPSPPFTSAGWSDRTRSWRSRPSSDHGAH